jgi:hypothetical protein
MGRGVSEEEDIRDGGAASGSGNGTVNKELSMDEGVWTGGRSNSEGSILHERCARISSGEQVKVGPSAWTKVIEGVVRTIVHGVVVELCAVSAARTRFVESQVGKDIFRLRRCLE